MKLKTLFFYMEVKTTISLRTVTLHLCTVEIPEFFHKWNGNVFFDVFPRKDCGPSFFQLINSVVQHLKCYLLIYSQSKSTTEQWHSLLLLSYSSVKVV